MYYHSMCNIIDDIIDDIIYDMKMYTYHDIIYAILCDIDIIYIMNYDIIN